MRPYDIVLRLTIEALRWLKCLGQWFTAVAVGVAMGGNASGPQNWMLKGSKR
jgi:hypothetical protein